MDDNSSPNDSAPPDDQEPTHRHIDVNSEEYLNSLTDPMSEVDTAFKGIREICARYGLAYFLLVTHPWAGKVKQQYASAAFAPASMRQMIDGVDIHVDQLSGGHFRVVQVPPKDENPSS